MVSIPDLRGREPKERAVKNLSEIIGARMKEIIDLVYHDIKVSGYENKLMTGIVLTGGGCQLKNLQQLVSFITAKETRIGYPNEHLSSESKDLVTSPMYSTGVGLVLKGFEKKINTFQNDNSEEKENVEKKSGSLLAKFTSFFEDEID